MISDKANITSGSALGLINQFTEIAKEVGDVVLKLIILDLYGLTTVATTLAILRCALFSKPIGVASGVPTSSDMSDPRYVVSRYGVGVAAGAQVMGYHWRQPLKIMVPAGNQVHIACQQDSSQTVAAAFDVRLFWQSL